MRVEVGVLEFVHKQVEYPDWAKYLTIPICIETRGHSRHNNEVCFGGSSDETSDVC